MGDRKIEIPLPNEQARLDILKIHSRPLATHGEIDFEAIVKLSDTFNGADLRNVCTEAGLFAIRAERDFINQEDMMKAVRKVPNRSDLNQNWITSRCNLRRTFFRILLLDTCISDLIIFSFCHIFFPSLQLLHVTVFTVVK